MNNFLSIYDLDHNLVQSFIKSAVETKNSKNNDDFNFANGKILASIFEKPSTRTRLSFDVAMRKLGGQCIIIDQNKLHLGNNKESISDTAKTLSQYVDIVMYRSQSHESLQKLASFSTVPIINGLSDFSHPCQAMADLLTIYEKKSDSQSRAHRKAASNHLERPGAGHNPRLIPRTDTGPGAESLSAGRGRLRDLGGRRF